MKMWPFLPSVNQKKAEVRWSHMIGLFEGKNLAHTKGMCVWRVHPFNMRKDFALKSMWPVPHLIFPFPLFLCFVLYLFGGVGRRRMRKGDYVCGYLWMFAQRILSIHYVLSQDWNWMASAFAHGATSLPHPTATLKPCPFRCPVFIVWLTCLFLRQSYSNSPMN